jgi:acyl-CoA reductase-like NAD-dependent aldehyde dehydrogenase
MDSKYSMLIDGKLVQASSGATMEIINPADGKAFAIAPKGSPAEIDKAVEAAWKAQPAWAVRHVADRGKLLFELARLIRSHHDELAKLETMQYGGPMFKTSNFDIPFSAELLEYYAGVGRGLSGFTLPAGPTCRAMTVREPLGVVGLITPWNFPLVTALAKVAPALITGNTCVVKPPSCAPLTVLKVGEFAVEAGVPAGLINIVTGPGSTTGEALVTHPKVAKISFTGDSSTGKRIMSLASAAIKPVASELGGKNAFIVLADADLDAAVEGAVWGSFFNSGQNCGSPSRFFIQEPIYDQFVDRFVAIAKKLSIGDPLKMETMVGPVAYEGHRDGIERFVQGAKRSRAKLLLGGERPNTPETKNGFFVAPTIFGDCNNRAEFMQEEIFGPVVGLVRIQTPEEAIALTNDTRYGLCASVWTKDVRLGLVMADQIKTGTVWINQHLSIVFEIPWGGCKESGWSKENSTLALDEYTMQKHVWIDLAGTPKTPWEGKL